VFLTKEHLDLKQRTSKHENVGKRWIQPMLKLNAVAAVGCKKGFTDGFYPPLMDDFPWLDPPLIITPAINLHY
jgi:hypothetical protein